ncbi:S28 family serine protease [Streptomyces sp. NPDC056149]|uniref:S28 family serine protease n=1 Tax=Streptomyces sp. NPDC056149 TaxID=3345728 RepID=UPI0035D60A98
MRTRKRWLLTLAALISAVSVSAPTTVASAAGRDGTDIKDRLLAIPGMHLIEEQPVDGYRYFVLDYTQPIDHRHPDRGTFQQRLTVLHKSVDRPTVFYTSGYNVSTTPSRSEPTKIIDGNQVSLEYRYFTPSRPVPTDWKKLDIKQAATDQHRIFQALHAVYPKNWIATGGSKGGMTATYYRRFFPHDMNGTVAYVAPNNTDRADSRPYDRFFATVGTPACRTAVGKIEREALLRRDEMVNRYEKWAADNKRTFRLIGNADRAYEVLVTDLVFGFWQYQPAKTACAELPAPTASTDTLWTWIDKVGGFDSYTDQGLEKYQPYYYQAGTQLGEPKYHYPNLRGLLRYPGINNSRSFVPRSIPMPFDRRAMPDVDRWVRQHATRMMFVNGQFDPWSAKHFQLGRGARDSYLYTVPGGNHGSNIAQLKDADRTKATASLLTWAGLPVPAGGRSLVQPPYNTTLDRPQDHRELTLRP